MHRSVTLLAAFAVCAAMLPLSGCSSRSAYYQARTLPSSSEASFASSEQWFWEDDHEVYELVSNPPAIDEHEDDAHRPRVECRRPGQRFLATPLASGGHEPARGYRANRDVDDLATLDDTVRPSGPAPERPQPIATTRQQLAPGAREDMGRQPLAGVRAPISSAPGSDIGQRAPIPMAVSRERDDWCQQ